MPCVKYCQEHVPDIKRACKFLLNKLIKSMYFSLFYPILQSPENQSKKHIDRLLEG